jgi:subtilisin family serine protease
VKHTAALPLFILIAAVSYLRAQEIVPGKYIVELSGESLAEVPKSKQAGRRAAMQTERLRVRAALAARSVQVTGSVEAVANALLVDASPEQAAAIAATPGVMRVTPVKLYRKLLDRAVGLQRIREGWAQLGGNGNAGAGIKIAVIDTGIDASHPAFADPALQVPDGFPKVNRDIDLQNTNTKVIVARNYERGNSAKDVDGHGTGVAMIAAGVTNAGPLATITGIAPKAFLGNYKVFPDDGEGARSDYVLKALDDAFADGMDIVNLSLGSYPSERFSDDPLAQAVERATQQGMIVVVAAGNEGPDLYTIATPATAPSAIVVGNAFTDRVFASTASFDDEAYIVLPGSGRNSTTPIRAAVFDVGAVDSTGLACTALAPDSLRGRIALILRGTCFFEEKLNNAQRAGAIAAIVYAREESPEAITMSVGDARLPAAMVSSAAGLRIKARIAEDSERILVLDFSQRPFAIDPSRLSQSSSKGPNNDFSIKPDLVAVGTSVYTAAPDGGYLAESGTSFSAPMVAGAAAVLKAARPGLSAQQYRSLLINNASTFAALPVQQTGVGILNLENALRGTVTSNPPSIAFNAGGGTVDLTRSFSLRNLSTSPDTFTITVVPFGGGAIPAVSANTIDLAPGASQEIIVRLQGTNLPPQAYEGVLVVRGTQSDVESRIPYWYAVPSQRASVISVIEPPGTGRTSSTQRLRFHVLDSAGVPLTGEPKVTAERGGGLAMSVESLDSTYPGLFVASVRLSEIAGENMFAIEAGGIRKLITITGE